MCKEQTVQGSADTAPFLETLDVRLDQALCNLIELCMSLFIVGEMN